MRLLDREGRGLRGAARNYLTSGRAARIITDRGRE